MLSSPPSTGDESTCVDVMKFSQELGLPSPRNQAGELEVGAATWKIFDGDSARSKIKQALWVREVAVTGWLQAIRPGRLCFAFPVITHCSFVVKDATLSPLRLCLARSDIRRQRRQCHWSSHCRGRWPRGVLVSQRTTSPMLMRSRSSWHRASSLDQRNLCN